MIHALNQKGTVEEAIGYVAEHVDKKAQKIVVIVVSEEGRMEGYGFGEVKVPDLAFFGSYLQKRAMDAMD